MNELGYKISQSTIAKSRIFSVNLHPVEPIKPKIKPKKRYRICTWNIWGVEPFGHFSLLDQRLKYIFEQIKNEDLDIICLQEVSQTVIDNWILKEPWIKQNYYLSYVEAPWSEKPSYRNGQMYSEPNVFCYILSKIKPEKIAMNILTGEISFSCLTARFPDFTIVNLHLQSGGKYSNVPHPEKYHQCRKEQMTNIFDLVSREYAHERVIYVGDFNFHLDGEINVWPELSVFNEQNLRDVWLEHHPHHPGYTEDTTINQMRYLLKQSHKQFRYDGILYKGNIDFEWIKMIGLDPVFHVEKDNKQIPWWPSDHFGLVTELTLD